MAPASMGTLLSIHYYYNVAQEPANEDQEHIDVDSNKTIMFNDEDEL